MIAIIGSKGQLGWELVRQGQERGEVMLAADVDRIDITSAASVAACFKEHPIELVVNAAAFTAVDRAESEPEAAFAVNRDGPQNLARYCRDAGAGLIHVSTDYVFDGSQKHAYTESDPVSPLGVYGRSKAAGEAAVRGELDRHMILRTAWLCGLHGGNFVKTMLRLGREKEAIRVVDDQHGCPTFAADLAAAIWTMVDRIRVGQVQAWGTYHFCNAGETTWYGFAAAIFEEAGRYETFKLRELVPVPSEAYPTAAARPKHSELDCQKLEQVFGVRRRHWKQGLQEMLAGLYAEIL